MDNIQEQMNAIIGNPEMMQKIMSMAQNLSQSQPKQDEEVKPKSNLTQELNLPDIDISLIQRLSGFVGQTNIDANQKTLLTALSPYLSRERIVKLEKAMRAAKMANLASVFLNNSGLLSNLGR